MQNGWREIRFGQVGEANRTPRPIEEAGSEFAFELQDLCEREGCETWDWLGGAAERAGGPRTEVAELVTFHRLLIIYRTILEV